MSNTIRIRRRAAGGGAGQPTTFYNAELAYNEDSNILYYGYGTNGGGGNPPLAGSAYLIAGHGAYMTLGNINGATGQTITGTKTITGSFDFTGGTLTAATKTTGDDSTAVATTAFVKAQKYAGSDNLYSRGTSTGTSNSSAVTVYNLATYRSSSSTTTGAIVFVAPTNATTIMHLLTIQGMLWIGGPIIHALVQGYRASASVDWSQISKVNLGVTDVDVRWGLSPEGNACLILGDVGTVWSYPQVSITCAMLSHSGLTSSYYAPWSVGLVTDLTSYTRVTSVISDSTIRTSLNADDLAAGTVNVARIPSLTAAKISDFDTQVRANRLDQLAAPTTSVSLNSQKITGLAEPVNSTDAATKSYVDSVAQGLDVKASARAATTANITLSGAQTIDGVSVVAGDRVLVKNQSSASANGLYVAAAGAWSRATDADAWAELISAFVFIEEGTTNADTGWVCTVNAGGTLNSTSVTWAQFSGAGTYTAGNGLNLSGGQFTAVGTTNRITVGAGGIDISSSYVGQTSITTLGTVATGTWSATTIAVNKGGTGATTLTGILKGNGTSAFTAAVDGTDYLSPDATIDGGTY